MYWGRPFAKVSAVVIVREGESSGESADENWDTGRSANAFKVRMVNLDGRRGVGGRRREARAGAGRGTRRTREEATGVVADASSSSSSLLRERRSLKDTPCSPMSDTLDDEGSSPRTLGATEPEPALAA